MDTPTKYSADPVDLKVATSRLRVIPFTTVPCRNPSKTGIININVFLLKKKIDLEMPIFRILLDLLIKDTYTYKVLVAYPFPKEALVFACLLYKSFENTVEKEEIAQKEQFLFFPKSFYLFGELPAIFIKFEIVVCKLFEFGRVQNLLFGKGLYFCFIPTDKFM